MLIATAALGGCAEAVPPEIRIGLLPTLSGQFAASSGLPTVEGATLSVDEVNSAGVVTLEGRRHPVTLVMKYYYPRPDAASGAAVSLTVGASGAASVEIVHLLTPAEVDEAAKKSPAYRVPYSVVEDANVDPPSALDVVALEIPLPGEE